MDLIFRVISIIILENSEKTEKSKMGGYDYQKRFLPKTTY